MLERILPLIVSISLIVFYVFAVQLRKNKGTVIVMWDRNTSLILAALIMILHVVFMLYFLINNHIYLYLLHTDLCTMLYPWVSFALIFNKRRLLGILMPIAITAGFMELSTQKMTFEKEHSFDEVMSLFKHTTLIFTGIYIYMNLTKYSWKDFFLSISWVSAFTVYIILVVGIPYWVTGNEKIGVFSMGVVSPSYRDVDASWDVNTPYIVGEFKVLDVVGYPWGTIILLSMATAITAIISWGANISSKFEIKELKKSLVKN